MTRHLSNFFGFLFLGLAIVGAFLPLIPTTPFILLATFFFAAHNPKIMQRLLDSRWGPDIVAWQKHRIIPLKAKIISTTMMAISTYISWNKLDRFGLWVQIPVVIIMLSCALIVWNFKSKPQKSETSA